MDINQFRSPLDEQVDNILITFDDIILNQYAPNNTNNKEEN